MNERIRELASQCYELTKPDLNERFNKEKFAELIVEECAELMETQHTWITSVAASTLIRNHFKNEKF